jgi:DNA-binding transcriptional ArsR family regulator
MTNDIKPQRTYSLKTEEQVKSYVHPTRMNILKMLAKTKRTISSVAKELKVHPANITHHFKLLEKSGLIRLVEKRDTGRNLEKYYRAAAFNYNVRINEKGEVNKEALALSILRDDLSIAIDVIKGKKGATSSSAPKYVKALITTARLDTKRVNLFEKKLAELIKEFSKNSVKNGTAYTLNMSLYPNDADCLPDNVEVIIK